MVPTMGRKVVLIEDLISTGGIFHQGRPSGEGSRWRHRLVPGDLHLRFAGPRSRPSQRSIPLAKWSLCSITI